VFATHASMRAVPLNRDRWVKPLSLSGWPAVYPLAEFPQSKPWWFKYTSSQPSR